MSKPGGSLTRMYEAWLTAVSDDTLPDDVRRLCQAKLDACDRLVERVKSKTESPGRDA